MRGPTHESGGSCKLWEPAQGAPDEAQVSPPPCKAGWTAPIRPRSCLPAGGGRAVGSPQLHARWRPRAGVQRGPWEELTESKHT